MIVSRKKPLIGITCNYDYRDGLGNASGVGAVGQDWNYVAGDYVYALEKAGAIPVLIPQYKDIDIARAFIDQLDGILVSGGHDVGPELYGAFPKNYCGMVFPQRDAQDIALTKYALEKGIPMFGICRGIQILNVALGGTLYQDIEIEGGFEHHSNGERYPRNAPWHPVVFPEGSPLREILGKEGTLVNSYHHQAVREPGKNVKIIASSSDGLTEGIKVEGGSFAMAVQWHPEMMYDSDEALAILKYFVDACSKED